MMRSLLLEERAVGSSTRYSTVAIVFYSYRYFSIDGQMDEQEFEFNSLLDRQPTYILKCRCHVISWQ